MNKTIYFVRHGQTDLNKQMIVQGSGVDSSINQTGREQAAAFFNYYQNQNFDLVISSALQRTRQTIQPFIDIGVPYEEFADINEMHWGVHEGKKSEPWMHKEYKTMIKEWQEGNFDARLTGGESASELATRVERFIDMIKMRPEQKILVCSHGRTMRCIMCILKGEHLRQMEKHKHSNTGLFLVHQQGNGFSVELENDRRHLDDI